MYINDDKTPGMKVCCHRIFIKYKRFICCRSSFTRYERKMHLDHYMKENKRSYSESLDQVQDEVYTNTADISEKKAHLGMKKVRKESSHFERAVPLDLTKQTTKEVKWKRVEATEKQNSSTGSTSEIKIYESNHRMPSGDKEDINYSKDFSDIYVPDLGHFRERYFTMPIPSPELLPKNASVSEKQCTLDLARMENSSHMQWRVMCTRHETKMRKNVCRDCSYENGQRFRHKNVHSQEKSTTRCSYTCTDQYVKRNAARNWKQYKLQMLEKEAEQLLVDTEMGPLWKDERCTPLVKPWKLNSVQDAWKYLNVIKNAQLPFRKPERYVSI